MKKAHFINILERLKGFENPKLQWEQYSTDAVASADFLYFIAFEMDDLRDNLILDFGCGPGRLSLGAALLGAEVIGIDIDPEILTIFGENQKSIETRLEHTVNIVQADITAPDFIPLLNHRIQEIYPSRTFQKTIVITNPPFGVHNRGADIQFLTQASEVANIIYSIHQSGPKSRTFLEKKIIEMKGKITHHASLEMYLPHSYKFHSKSRKKIQTDVFRTEILK